MPGYETFCLIPIEAAHAYGKMQKIKKEFIASFTFPPEQI